MERDVVWHRVDDPGIEHLHLISTSDGYLADGELLSLEEGMPLRAHYTIRCDSNWHVREATVSVGAPIRTLVLRADGVGHWQVRTNAQSDTWEPVPALDGCIDVDIYPSPFTNTLAIRRLRLAPGASAEIAVAFIKLPELTVQPATQRYTCLAADATGARYRYEGLQSSYQTELPVDAEGLVLEYPDWFARVFP